MPTAHPDPSDLFHPLAGCGPAALAVSGGSDSLALMRLAHDWQKAQARPPRLTVLTVDHGLRAAAADEALAVARWSAACGLPHVTLWWQGEKPVTGIQAKARAARYDLMSAWCAAHGAGVLLTAHTLDDQAETVVMRLARTSSIDSLAGITADGHWRSTRLVRPLLGMRREALRDYLRTIGQPWIDDPSNEDERFERVRIRKALPVLAEIGIGAERLAAFAAEMRVESERLRGAADDWVRSHVPVFDTGYAAVPRAAFARETKALKIRILGALIPRFGAGGRSDPAQLQTIAAWAEAGEGSPRATLGGALLARRRAHFLIGREPGRLAVGPQRIPASGRLLWDDRFEVEAQPGADVVPVAALGIPRNPALPAFVQNCLPAVVGVDGSVCVPQLGLGQGATARFRWSVPA